jgi:hypothetical protein
MTFSPFSVRLLAVFIGGSAALLASGCGKSVSVGGPKAASDVASDRPVRIEHEACDTTKGKSDDTNADGKADIVTVEGVCQAFDLNHDGRFDRYVYFDSSGGIRRIESDYDRDGRIDEVSVFVGGKLVRKDREMNLDGRVDTWDIFEEGKLVRRERDSDGDGKIDQWWTFPDPNNLACPVVAVDKDGDGKPDPGSEVDMCKPQGDEPQNLLASSGATGATPSASAAPPPAPAPAPSGSSGSSK